MSNAIQTQVAACREAVRKAVDFQISYQRPDGGYIWDGYAVDAYHKQAYSWSLTGHFSEGHKLLDWILRNKLGPDGQLEAYQGDVYKHAWLFQGALRLGRFDVAVPVWNFLKSCQYANGGFPHFKGNGVIRAIGTAWTGISALYAGDLALAKQAAACCLSMQRQQHRADRYYFQMKLSGELYTEADSPDAEFIDTGKTKQCYWEVGFSMLLMCKLYQITHDPTYLESARRFFEFKLKCRDDAFAYWGSGKSALAAAHYYMITGDERARDASLRFMRFVVETQRPNGGFQYEDEPDELLIYVDHAACFSVWCTESISIMASKIL